MLAECWWNKVGLPLCKIVVAVHFYRWDNMGIEMIMNGFDMMTYFFPFLSIYADIVRKLSQNLSDTNSIHSALNLLPYMKVDNWREISFTVLHARLNLWSFAWSRLYIRHVYFCRTRCWPNCSHFAFPIAGSPRSSTTLCWPRPEFIITTETTLSSEHPVESSSASQPSPSPTQVIWLFHLIVCLIFSMFLIWWHIFSPSYRYMLISCEN